MKAFAYLRVSSQGQVEKDGFPRQREAVNRCAKSQSITITREFCEEGLSGETEWGTRPAFLDMVSAIMDNGVRTIIVENLTRLARSYTIQEAILVYLASKKIALISADSGEDITEALQGEPMKIAMIQMQSVFSQLEKNSLVRKLRAARDRKKAATGRCEGRKPFGITKAEKATIRRMIELRETDMSYAGIADVLDAERHPTRSGKKWSAPSVRNIINRES